MSHCGEQNASSGEIAIAENPRADSDPPPPPYESVCLSPSATSCSPSSVPSASQLPKYGDVAVLDPPPTYHSMFSDPLGDMIRTLGPFAERRYVSRGMSSADGGVEAGRPVGPLLGEHTYRVLCVGMLLLIITVTMSVVLPLIMIIIGIVYVNQCPVQPRIPIYLIVLGFFQMTECCGRLACRCLYDVNSHSPDSCRARYQKKDPLFYFLVVWFVIGSMWVYQTNPDCQNCGKQKLAKGYMKLPAGNITNVATHPANAESALYCDHFVYSFAFWTVTVYYSLLAIFSFFILADLLLRVIGRCCRRR